jgi:enoyl-CoA hydratase
MGKPPLPYADATVTGPGRPAGRTGDPVAPDGRRREHTDVSDANVLLVNRAGAGQEIAVLTMNRPQARNALNPELREALAAELKSADADPSVRAVILTGAGSVFCAGMDLKSFAQGASSAALTWFFREGIGTPTIAALNGTAVAGGFELALACDLIVAAEGAKVGIPEVKRGLFAAGGGTTLANRIPLATALELGLTGDPVSVGRAQQIGLVNQVVPAGEVLKAATELAERIAANAPLSVAMTKKLMRERRWGTPEEIGSVFRSADAREGAIAFAERRQPRWTGQ